MKTIYSMGLCLLMTAMNLASCADEWADDAQDSSTETVQTIPVELNAELTPFDVRTSSASRATSLTWKNGDVIYLQFTTSDGTTSGTATYYTGHWTATANKPLVRDKATKCVAYYFDGAATVDGSLVNVEATTGVYADLDASYTYPTNGRLSITCDLKPQTSRIRFKGTAGTTFTLSGMTCATNFKKSSPVSLTRSSTGVTVKINSNGYSPYIYGNFTDTENPWLNVVRETTSFTAKCQGKNMLITGESGYMTLPTSNSHNGWTVKDLPIKNMTVGGVTFNMILVGHGSFKMGSTGTSDPIHSVTISKDYFIGETEVTQALWKAVTGYSPTATSGEQWKSIYGMGDNYPAYHISYEDVQGFITKLNQMTGEKFRMPTEAEWEFAARGGNKSKDYTYSGSNIIGGVAWYAVNALNQGTSSPDYGTHVVKRKSPNELGIYDMSGNVSEWCSDWFASYSDSSQTDPTGPASGSNRVFRGGAWDNSATLCRSTYRSYNGPLYRSNGLGFRLAL